MKLKKVLLSIGCLGAILMLSGCGKVAKTSAEIKDLAQNYGYSVIDKKEQLKDYDYIKEAITIDNNKWEIEFYVLEQAKYAKDMFNTTKETFENYKGNAATEASTSFGNEATYTLTSNGFYMHVCQIDNTLLYFKVSVNDKEEVKKIVEELGYN